MSYGIGRKGHVRETYPQTAALPPVSITYGSGQDGDFTFDGVATPSYASRSGTVYTLTRDVFVRDWHIPSGSTVQTAGYHVFGSGVLTIDDGGLLINDGKNASGGTAGAGSALGTLGIGTAGGAGHANAVGSAGTNQSNTLYDASALNECAGGHGGAGGANAGGAGGTYAGSAANGGANFLTPMLTGFLFTQTSGGNQAQAGIIGGGAGGGGGGSDNAGVTGGGGGGGGGVLHCCFATIINNGIIGARGGNGAAASGSGGNGGGGAGGGGGIVLSLARVRSDTGTYDVSGGVGGAGFGTGAAGANGAVGHVNAFFAL